MYVRTKIYGAINAKAMSTRFSLYRYYLGLHYWLRARCDRLSPKARRYVVYGISMLYLACSLTMLVQVFYPRQEARQLPIPRRQYLDAPLRPSRLDSLGRELSRITHQKIAHYG